jgi:hypothetical protein
MDKAYFSSGQIAQGCLRNGVKIQDLIVLGREEHITTVGLELCGKGS